MFDFFLDSLNHFVRNGFSWATVAGLVILMLRNRKYIKLLKILKMPVHDEEEELKQRLENKLDAIMKAVGAEWNQTSGGLQKKDRTSLKRLYNLLHKDIYRESRSRRNKMRNYLKKLGSRKFQAYLLTTILNIVTMIALWTGNVNIEGQFQEYMPVVNLVIQLLATGVYTWVEGKADVAGAVKAEGAITIAESSGPITSEK